MFQEKEHTSTIWAANYFSLTPVVSNPGTTTTTLYTYDNNGNLTGVGSSTTYAYDFDNRLIQSVINGVTTTYAYDPFGSRIMQATASSTTWYPNQFVSITNATSSTLGTSTDYVYAGSTLFETVDQPLVSGVATGTPVTRYIHTDNLGSTNITSDANQNRAQWFDYAPYGSIVASTNTGTTTDARQYIGQYTDNTGLSYLNARYYNSAQGQFLSEDPVFWGQQNLQDPQSFNAYSYAEGNPITGSDPSGKCGVATPICIAAAAGYTGGFLYAYGADIYSRLGSGEGINSVFPTNDRVNTYTQTGLKGAFTAAGVAASLMAAPASALDFGSSMLAKYLYSAGSAYSFSNSYDILSNALQKKSPNGVDMFGNAIDSAISPLGIGPRDIGRMPSVNPFSSMRFMNTSIRESIGNIISGFTQNAVSTPSSGGGSGGGAPITVYQLLQSGANQQFIANNWSAVGGAVSQYNSTASAKK